MSTPLDKINSKIAATEAKLEVAERVGDNEKITLWGNLLIKQQEEKNLLLADQSKFICII